MSITINGHRVVFFASGRIAVDDKTIALAINAASGGHYTYIADDRFAVGADKLAALAGRKLTGPGRKVGQYEETLAAEIVAALNA